MKRFIYLFTIFAIAATSVASAITLKPSKSLETKPVNDNDRIINYKADIAPEYKQMLMPSVDPELPEEPRERRVGYTLSRQERAQWEATARGTSPFVYDPASGYYFVTTFERLFPDDGPFRGTRNDLYILKNMHEVGNDPDLIEVDTLVLFDEPDIGGFYPSISVSNPNNVEEPTYEDFIYTNVNYLYLQSDGEWFGDGLMMTWGSLDDYTYDYMLEPETNNVDNYTYNRFKPREVIKDGEVYHCGGSLASPPPGGLVQYGSYNFMSWDPVEEEAVFDGMPTKMDWREFRDNDDPLTSYQSPMEVDGDDEGNLYAAVNNVYEMGDPGSDRRPGVFKSTDMGLTWEDINIMPEEIFANYASALGYFDFNPYYVFSNESFIVTGVDEYSYITRLALMVGNDTEEIHLVEVYYRGGAWGISKIADIEYPSYFEYELFANGNDIILNDGVLTFKIENVSWRHNEIEVGQTKDGELVVKWVENNPNLYTAFDPAVTVMWDNDNDADTPDIQTNLDTVYHTDIYCSYRDNSGEAWKGRIAVTNDSTMNKGTFLPRKIESLTDCAILDTRTGGPVNTTSEFGMAWTNTPLAIRNAVVDWANFYSIYMVNLTIADVEENEPIVTNFNINSIRPNPARENVEVYFNMEQTTNVSLKLYNQLGQLVNVILDGPQGSGVHAKSFSVANLSNGTYYLVLSDGTNSQTQVLNVVK